MFKDRGVLMPDWLINDLTQFSSRTVSEESTINYSKKKVIELKEELEQRGIAFRKCAKKAELIRLLENPNGIFTDSGNKENIPPKIDKASKQDVDSGKYPSGGIKRLEKTTKKPSMRTTSSSSNLNSQPALSQPENQYYCAKCGHLFASEELHKDPTSGDAYYAYLRYEDHTSNKTYCLQITKSGTEDLYYVRRHWGRYGTSNFACKYDVFKSPDDAIAKFGEIFEEKTSLDWGNRGMGPKKKKYSYIKPKDGSSLQVAEDRNVGSSDRLESHRTDLVDDNLS
ncbi:hypothetical protein KCU98_g18048, partial [Aureobasidium melanogenum]